MERTETAIHIFSARRDPMTVPRTAAGLKSKRKTPAKRPGQPPRAGKSGAAKVVPGKGGLVAAAQARELDERLARLKAKVQALNDNADQLLARLAETSAPRP